MRIDHRPLIDISSNIDVRWRHNDDASGHKRAVANGGTAGHDAYLMVQRKPLQRVRALIEKPKLIVDGKVGYLSESEAEENPLLHPSIHPPSGRIAGDSGFLGCPDLAGIEKELQLIECSQREIGRGAG